jgi:hypothetical protein
LTSVSVLTALHLIKGMKLTIHIAGYDDDHTEGVDTVDNPLR